MEFHKKKQMTEQQLKKGLFRLWIVVSVCWVLFVVIGFFILVIDSWMGHGLGKINWIELLGVCCLLLLPPVILLYLGKVSFWIARGFKKSD